MCDLQIVAIFFFIFASQSSETIYMYIRIESDHKEHKENLVIAQHFQSNVQHR